MPLFLVADPAGQEGRILIISLLLLIQGIQNNCKKLNKKEPIFLEYSCRNYHHPEQDKERVARNYGWHSCPCNPNVES
jgi:hypothetical protein